MFHNLAKNAEFRRIAPDGTAATTFTLAAGTSDVNSGIVDTLGFEAIAWIVVMGTLAASSAVTVQVQQDTDSAGGTMADLAGSEIAASAVTDDDKLLIIDIYRPQERYQRLQIIRGDGGNSDIAAVIAILYRPNYGAVDQGSTVEATEVHVSPAEGTA